MWLLLQSWCDNYGDEASVLGLIVSVVGAIATVYQSYMSRTASEKAREASEETRVRLRSIDSLKYLEEASTLLEQIKDDHLSDRWPEAMRKCSWVTRSLRQVHAQTPIEECDRIVQVICQLHILEKQVEKRVRNTGQTGGKHIDATRANTIIRTQQLELVSIQQSFASRLGA